MLFLKLNARKGLFQPFPSCTKAGVYILACGTDARNSVTLPFHHNPLFQLDLSVSLQSQSTSV